MYPGSPRELLRFIEREAGARFTPIEEFLGYGVRSLVVSGIGIVIGDIPFDLRQKLKRRCSVDGKYVSFHDIRVEKLLEFRDYVLFLVSSARIYSTDIPVKPEIAYYTAVFEKEPRKLKLKYPPWKIIRGEVTIGPRRFWFNWFMRIPTYSKYRILFLCHPKDLIRRVSEKRTTFPIINMVAMYRHRLRVRNKITEEGHATLQTLLIH